MTPTIVPHLGFDGNCAEALAFYAETLGGEISFMMTYGDSPMKDQFPVDMHGAVVHGTVKIGHQYIMGGDAPPHGYKKPEGVYVNLQYTDVEEGRRVFEALAHGGGEEMAFGETFWSKGFGMCTDRYGIHWMVNVGELM